MNITIKVQGTPSESSESQAFIAAWKQVPVGSSGLSLDSKGYNFKEHTTYYFFTALSEHTVWR